MKTLGERIKEFRKQMGLNQKEFAELCGKTDVRAKNWGQSRIGNYEVNAREPKLEDIEIIAKVIGVSPKDLAFGGDDIQNVILAPMGSKRIPIISYVQAGKWNDIVNCDSFDDANAIYTDLDVSDEAFALEIQGDSMEPDFKEGDVVIIDPQTDPIAGEFVAAINGDYEATFKKYRPLNELSENGKQHFELVPLNPDYPIMTTLKQEIRIIGTMVEHRIYRRKR